MKWIKKFEMFGNKSFFYTCDECDSNWEEEKEGLKFCKFCDSSDVEEINPDEYKELKESKIISKNVN
jgi:hypothetical protein